MNEGKVFIVSGPSGSGKDTILRRLFKENPQFKLSISCITRPRRGIPEEDDKYSFVSVERFKQMLDNDELLEHNIFLNNYYGTPKQPVLDAIKNGDTMIIECDVNGAFNIKKKLPQVKLIFIMPPSEEVLLQRLKKRATDTEEMIQKRFNEAKREIECSKQYDYIVVNGELDKAVDDVYKIICEK